MKTIILLAAVFLFSGNFWCQETINASDEAELAALLTDLRAAGNDGERAAKNKLFKDKLSKVLDKENALTYPFSSLSTVGFIDSPDGLVRIINWNVEQEDQSQRYFGFVVYHDKRHKEIIKTELVEDVFGLKQPDDVLEANQWYGALYYKIIPVDKGSRTMYTLLGWDGNTTLSNIKLIDVMYISGKSVKFGSPIFKLGSETKKRLFYEHSEKTTMMLNYEEDRKRIMMDHLSPETPSMKGFYSFYVPDLSYDALKFEKGKWTLQEDVVGVNSHREEKKQSIYTTDPKTGKVVERKIDGTWQNPTDPKAPVGGIEHVAVTPDAVPEDPNDVKKKKEKRTKEKKDNRDPNNLSITNGMGKKKRKRKN